MKNILIAVVGTTPQIISETVYFLSVHKKIKLDEIYVLTTGKGEKTIHESLLCKNILFNLYQDYKLDVSHQPVLQIECLKDRKGNILHDVRSASDNMDAARQIIDFVREKSYVPDSILHCSLAGGRKTMSSYMALAMNLFGRKNDHLTHVLVSPAELEYDREFYYPKPGDKKALIELAEIPFIRLREKLDRLFGDTRKLVFEDLLKLTNMAFSELENDIFVTLKSEERTVNVKIGNKTYEICLQPKLFAIYHFLFKNKESQTLVENPELIQLYKKYYSDGRKSNFSQSALSHDISDINRKHLKPNLPEIIFLSLQISADKESARNDYFIPLNFKSRVIKAAF